MLLTESKHGIVDLLLYNSSVLIVLKYSPTTNMICTGNTPLIEMSRDHCNYNNTILSFYNNLSSQTLLVKAHQTTSQERTTSSPTHCPVKLFSCIPETRGLAKVQMYGQEMQHEAAFQHAVSGPNHTKKKWEISRGFCPT